MDISLFYPTVFENHYVPKLFLTGGKDIVNGHQRLLNDY